MVDVKSFEARLLARQSELQQRLNQIEHDLDQPVSPDFEERATEREGDEVMETMGNSGLQELQAIDAALKRVASGTFGQCVTCGDDISNERLELVPTATQCKSCMQKG